MHFVGGMGGMCRRVLQEAHWYARYTDSAGRRVQKNTKCTDKAAAEGVLSEWRKKSEKVRAGFMRPEQEHIERSGPVKIEDVKKKYRQSLLQTGRTVKHADHADRVITALTSQCGIVRIIDINQATIEKYLQYLIENNRSARTYNQHKALIHGFCKYCARHGHLERNPAEYIESKNTAIDRRHVRRALTDDEIVKLLKAAEERPLHDARYKNTGEAKKMTNTTKELLRTRGRERRLIYLTLLTNGVRWSELRAVAVMDCVLDTKNPHLILKASSTKNRKADTVPLTLSLASELKKWIRESGKIGQAKLFNMPGNGAGVFNRDLVFAGIATAEEAEDKQGKKKVIVHKINENGETLDVHCLRHTCATRLARHGVPIATAQRILRHSDPKITMSIYSHLGLIDPKNGS